MHYLGKFSLFIVIVLCLTLCTELQIATQGKTSRNLYTERFVNKKLYDDDLEKRWEKSWDEVDSIPLEIELPYTEMGTFNEDDTEASAFNFKGKAGEIIIIKIKSKMDFFMEIYSRENTNTLLKSFDYSKGDSIGINVKNDTDYLVKIQPKLLSIGNYILSIHRKPSMIFPVVGVDNLAVQGFYGDTRDGGKRKHLGIDIFAKKGTPVISTLNGIAIIRNDNLGGKTIKVHNNIKGISAYYAHLDSQYVGTGNVAVGDTIGIVGNTGNAQYTSPHLHFGIYKRGIGAINPYPFIKIGRKARSVKNIHLLEGSREFNLKKPLPQKINPEIDVNLDSTFKILAVTNNKVRARLLGTHKDFFLPFDYLQKLDIDEIN